MHSPSFDNAGAAPSSTDSAERSAEVAATEWIFGGVRDGNKLAVAEAECVVNALYTESVLGGRVVFPPLSVVDPSTFLSVHAVNVATLAMALARQQQFDPPSIRSVGLAALLHDVGMARISADVWRKEGKLTPAEREVVKSHPVEGATLLLATHDSLDLAAVVAYEHHLTMDGSGYPKLTYPRAPHFVSRLVQVCDVFCSLSTDRPYRKAWPLDVILSFLDERSGFEFHPTVAATLTTMVREDLALATI